MNRPEADLSMHIAKGERGSISPLLIGFLFFSLATVLVVVSATSLIIFQKRLTGLAEASALWGEQTGRSAEEFLGKLQDTHFEMLSIKDDAEFDGHTRYVELCAKWQPPLVVPWVTDSAVVCSRGLARSG
jgi:hypothetical protein